MAVPSTATRPIVTSEQQRGIFITLEGGEGAGKSVQARALADRIAERGLTAVVTREPGGTTLGERLRHIALDLSGSGATLDPLAETFLFLAARAELVATVIAPALARRDIVICDRFADSTLAYQGFGRGVDRALIEALNDAATRGLRPHLTVLLDLPVEEGLARTGATGQADRFGREGHAFHQRVRDGYLSLAGESERWLVVDTRQPPEAVTEAIWDRVEQLLHRA